MNPAIHASNAAHAAHAAHQCFLVVAVVACTVAALVDLRTGQIPNWLTLGLLGTAPVAHAALAFAHPAHAWSTALAAAGWSLAAGVGSALVPLALARSGGLGLGDVKLFAAIGAACGVFVAVYAQTYAYVFAMVYALALVARQKRLAQTFRNIERIFGVGRPAQAPASPVAPADDVPSTEGRHAGFTEVKFGPAILAGMCVAAWARWQS